MEVCFFHLEVCPLRTDVLVATTDIYFTVYTSSMRNTYSERYQEYLNESWKLQSEGKDVLYDMSTEASVKSRLRIEMWSGHNIEEEGIVDSKGELFREESKVKTFGFLPYQRKTDSERIKELQELYNAIEEIRKEFGLHGFYNPALIRIEDGRKKDRGVLQFVFTLAPHSGDPRDGVDHMASVIFNNIQSVSIFKEADDKVFTKSKSEFLAIAREIYEQVSSDNRNWDDQVEEFQAELDEEIRIQDIAEKKLLDDFGKFGVKMVGRESVNHWWGGKITDNARNFEGELENGLKVVGTLEHGKVSSLNVETKPEDSAKLLELISHVGKGLDSIQG